MLRWSHGLAGCSLSEVGGWSERLKAEQKVRSISGEVRARGIYRCCPPRRLWTTPFTKLPFFFSPSASGNMYNLFIHAAWAMSTCPALQLRTSHLPDTSWRQKFLPTHTMRPGACAVGYPLAHHSTGTQTDTCSYSCFSCPASLMSLNPRATVIHYQQGEKQSTLPAPDNQRLPPRIIYGCITSTA